MARQIQCPFQILSASFDFFKNRDNTLNHKRYGDFLNILNIQDSNIPVLVASNYKPLGDFISNMNEFYNAYEASVLVYNINTRNKSLRSKDTDFNTINICNNLSCIQAEKYNAIFICRNDRYIPSHLDYAFEDLIQDCERQFNCIIVEPEVMAPRDARLTNVVCNHERMLSNFLNMTI